MSFQKYLAELLGTFFLTLAVLLSLSIELPISTPLLVGLTVGLFVYTVGSLSGAHFNPAVTISLATVQKIKVGHALAYIIFQFLGAGLAVFLAKWLLGEAPSPLIADNTWTVGVAEALGTFLLVFGISAVVSKKVHAAASGLVIGGSLALGLHLASGFSNAILNPAVAWGIQSVSWMYMVAPLAGGLVAAWLFTGLNRK